MIIVMTIITVIHKVSFINTMNFVMYNVLEELMQTHFYLEIRLLINVSIAL